MAVFLTFIALFSLMIALTFYVGKISKGGKQVRYQPRSHVLRSPCRVWPQGDMSVTESRILYTSLALWLRCNIATVSLSACGVSSRAQVALHTGRLLRLLTAALITTYYISGLNMMMVALYCNVRASDPSSTVRLHRARTRS